MVGAVIFKVKEFFMEDSRVCFLYDILFDLAVFLVVSITRMDLSICVSVTRFSIWRLKGLLGFFFVSKKVLGCGQ